MAEDIDRINAAWNDIREHASAIGTLLEKRYPANEPPPTSDNPSIQREHHHELTLHIQMVIAEIIQAWIDAGSEREVTMENEILYEAIRNELAGW